MMRTFIHLDCDRSITQEVIKHIEGVYILDVDVRDEHHLQADGVCLRVESTEAQEAYLREYALLDPRELIVAPVDCEEIERE